MDVVVSFTEVDLVFINSEGEAHHVADDGWAPESLSRRDRAVLSAFLSLAVEKVEAAG